MSRISVRGLAVASATAVTTVGAVVGVASGADQGAAPSSPSKPQATTTLLADIPAGQQLQQASLTEQVQAQSDAADATAQAVGGAGRPRPGRQGRRRQEEGGGRGGSGQGEGGCSSRPTRRDSHATFAVQASYTVSEVQAMAKQIVGSGQYLCFSNIVTRESGWNYTATNASSGAYGLVQALPGSKMASAGADWQTNPATQIKWGLNYMNSRYGSPCDAWSFWQVNH